MLDGAPDEDDQGHRQGEDQRPHQDIDCELNEQNEGRLRNASLAQAGAGRVGGAEHEDHGGRIAMERSANLDDEGVGEADDGADESSEANRMRTAPEFAGGLHPAILARLREGERKNSGQGSVVSAQGTRAGANLTFWAEACISTHLE
jgi:hypothetical protein